MRRVDPHAFQQRPYARGEIDPRPGALSSMHERAEVPVPEGLHDLVADLERSFADAWADRRTNVVDHGALIGHARHRRLDHSSHDAAPACVHRRHHATARTGEEHWCAVGDAHEKRSIRVITDDRVGFARA